MGVASHLRIDLNEYDSRIRTFVPDYETMLAVVAGGLRLLATPQPVVVDLGIGTGALADACFAVHPDARLIGIDLDPGMLEAARTRLAVCAHVELRHGSFLDTPLPRADAFVACIALHHIAEPADKQAFYRRVHDVLSAGGVLLTADCFPGAHPALASRHREAWLDHLGKTYTRQEAEAYLETWASEDFCYPLEHELAWLRGAGLDTEVLWRREGFAVIAGFRRFEAS
ncbi:MAG: class I SAM-dependent methyltransferase [Gemmatimonadetes bacterium]|nr:class I SAM-dependent methyltransferase [Gemmatimonadota bacterium]